MVRNTNHALVWNIFHRTVSTVDEPDIIPYAIENASVVLKQRIIQNNFHFHGNKLSHMPHGHHKFSNRFTFRLQRWTCSTSVTHYSTGTPFIISHCHSNCIFCKNSPCCCCCNSMAIHNYMIWLFMSVYSIYSFGWPCVCVCVCTFQLSSLKSSNS